MGHKTPTCLLLYRGKAQFLNLYFYVTIINTNHDLEIQTKARFHKWEEDGLLGSKDDHVHAQEASQLIGMMCQRIQYLRKKKYKAIDPKKLSAYDRT